MEPKFYLCKKCGNLSVVAANGNTVPSCCGAPMELLKPNSTEAAPEKHLPVFKVSQNQVTVTVGKAEHPMQPEHFIRMIVLKTKQGIQMKELTPGAKPQAIFSLVEGDDVEAAYAFCNLHGLWMAELPAFQAKKEAARTHEDNYLVCKCNQVRYYDIVNEVHSQTSMNELLNVFENVRTSTHCSTGCGGCYKKVIEIISDELYK